MASSQVEIATSSPFGCAAVHNRRDSCFQNNINNLVNDTSRHRIDFTDLWVHRPQWKSPDNNECDNGNNHNSNRHKDKWARAREMVFSVDHSSTNFPKQSEVSNLGGVSSLVQKWRGFEANRTNNRSSMFQDSGVADPPTPAPSLNEDDSLAGDSESDRTVISGPPSSRGRVSDATEIERLRVTDIIRKLTNNDVGSDSPPRVRTLSDPSEHRCISPVVNSPRIRGRQAFNDLLMQMERDKHKELEGLVARKAVSKFSHRGRIQALLRFRFLHRGMEAQEGFNSNGKSPETPKTIQPHVMHIRERLNLSTQQASIRSGACQKEVIDNSSNLSIGNQQGNENQYDEVTNSNRCPPDHIQDSQSPVTSDVSLSCHKVNEENVRLVHKYGNLDHESNPFSVLINHETNCEYSNHSLAESAATTRTGVNYEETTESFHNIETNVHNKEEEATNHQVTQNNYDPTVDCEEPQSYDEGEPTSSNQHLGDTAMYWETDVSNPDIGWEEFQSDNQQQEGSNREWIDEVSRPRSDWEDLRQARYQEMLDPFLDNEEIRVLLGRRSVSTFLSSGLREKIDQVMISRAHGHETRKNDQTQDKKKGKFPEQVIASEKHEEEEIEVEQDEGGDYNDNFDEYEEAESSVGQQYNESDDYTDQITSSPPESWPQNQGHELSDYSYQLASPSTQQSLSNYYSQDSRHNSSDSAHPAIDIELIYDLRGHMEQLHREMSELRKSIKCCMDMQIKLQRSIKKEVAIALHHSETKNGRRNDAVKKPITSGGRCCVCCKMQVDSLLYRCGHMCTCFKCAHKLHWSSGKCPICRAPILDVVRTYSNHS